MESMARIMTFGLCKTPCWLQVYALRGAVLRRVVPAAATKAASPGSAPLRLTAVNAPAQGGPSHCNLVDTPGQVAL